MDKIIRFFGKKPLLIEHTRRRVEIIHVPFGNTLCFEKQKICKQKYKILDVSLIVLVCMIKVSSKSTQIRVIVHNYRNLLTLKNVLLIRLRGTRNLTKMNRKWSLYISTNDKSFVQKNTSCFGIKADSHTQHPGERNHDVYLGVANVTAISYR